MYYLENTVTNHFPKIKHTVVDQVTHSNSINSCLSAKISPLPKQHQYPQVGYFVFIYMQGYFLTMYQPTIAEVLSQKDASWNGILGPFFFRGMGITNTRGEASM
jgi:hypothetical protein